MGGKNETTIGGLRFHINGSDVHVHGENGSKFIRDASDFKDEIAEAFDSLKEQEGIVRILGNSNAELCVMKIGRAYKVLLVDDGSVKTSLEKFVKVC